MDGSAPSSQVATTDQYDKPHIPEGSRPGLIAMHADKPLAALKGDATQLIDRLQAGESVQQIAASFGISDVAVYTFLLRHVPEQWLEFSAGRCIKRIQDAADALDDETADKTKVYRVANKARLAQWELERANRKLYGETKNDPTGVTVQVLIARDGQILTNVVEGE